jgi:O-antigen/teichoic acid export membrane protein
MVWNIVISFVLAPLLIHHLGTEHYGTLLLIWSVTGILGIMNLGLGEATLRYVAHYYGDGDLPGVNRVFGATLSFYVVICLIVSTIMFAAAPAVASFLNIPTAEGLHVNWLLRLSALVFSLAMISRAFGAVPMALQRYDITTKINIGQSVVRSIGYVLLIALNFKLLHLVLCDLATNFVTLWVQAIVIRKLSPGVKLFPSFAFQGLREVFGYSIFSFLTYVFHMLHRESGKLILSRYLGPSSVAYFGTPDNVAQRIEVVISSGSETLLPRFSANRDPKVAQSLFLNGTWAALATSIVLFIPLVVLMPDFLTLWISAEFARQSAPVGQLLALSYITQAAFGPPATFFRGSGRPWFVTIVIALAGLATLVFSIMLVPIYGIMGVGYAYLIGSVSPLLGVLVGWCYMFGVSSVMPLIRWVIMPCVLAAGALAVEIVIRSWFGNLNWFGLLAFGGLFVGLTGVLVLGAEGSLGGQESPLKQVWERTVKMSWLIKGLGICFPTTTKKNNINNAQGKQCNDGLRKERRTVVLGRRQK